MSAKSLQQLVTASDRLFWAAIGASVMSTFVSGQLSNASRNSLTLILLALLFASFFVNIASRKAVTMGQQKGKQ